MPPHRFSCAGRGLGAGHPHRWRGDIRESTMVVLTDLGSQDELGFPERGVKLFDIRLP